MTILHIVRCCLLLVHCGWIKINPLRLGAIVPVIIANYQTQYCLTADGFHSSHSYLPSVKRRRNFQYVGLRFCTSITACAKIMSHKINSYSAQKKCVWGILKCFGMHVCTCVTHSLETDSGGDGVKDPVGMREVREAPSLNALKVHGLQKETDYMCW